jgi:hypothetical protein
MSSPSRRATGITARRSPIRSPSTCHGGEIYGEESGRLTYRLYDRMPGTKGGLWTYRRLLSAEVLGARAPHDLTLINWPGNDYRDRSIIDRPADEVAASLQDAKRVSLGFLHWLQTEAPTSGDRQGAPEIMLRPDAMGTDDGLSKHPYIRESRRIVALKTIVESEVSAQFQAGPVPRRSRIRSASAGIRSTSIAPATKMSA